MGRIPAFNAALPERPIGPQIIAVSGPLARTIGDLRIALAAMSARDVRDPWWVPAPLEGPPMPKRVALCLNPDGLDPVAEVKAAVADAGKRLERAGWTVEEIANTPPLREAAELQTKLWLGDGYEAQLEMAEREGDPGALACLRGNRAKVHPFDAALLEGADAARDADPRMAAVLREICRAADAGVRRIAVPRSARPQGRASFARVWHAQMPQIAIPFMGLPGLTVSTGLVGRFRSACRSSPAAIARISALRPARRSRRAERRRRRSIPQVERADRCQAIYDFTAKSLAGEEVPLKRFEGQVLLIVNTASACGFTPQYRGWRRCIANCRRAALRCSAFPATSSARRSRATPRQIEAVLRKQV